MTLKKLKEKFPNRINFVPGDSKTKIKSYNGRMCHIVHISVPQNEMFDLYNFRKIAFEDTLVTATALNKHFPLYSSIFPDAKRLYFIKNFTCETVESVPLSYNLFMSNGERSSQIH